MSRALVIGEALIDIVERPDGVPPNMLEEPAERRGRPVAARARRGFPDLHPG